MYCTNCGNYNSEDAKNCTSCGSPMNAGPSAQQESSASGYQPYNPQPSYNQSYNPSPIYSPTEIPGKGAGIASLILGILSLVFFCLYYVSIPAGIAGIITGCIATSKAKSVGAKNGMGVAGIICSTIGLIISIAIVALAVGFLVTEFGDYVDFLPY